MMEWQPIDTAPKDGTTVKAGAESSFGEMWGVPFPTDSRFIGGEWQADFDGKWKPYEPQPTHWKPKD